MNVIVVAAGSGKRMESNIPKQYYLLDKKPVLYYSLKTLESCSLIKHICVVISYDAQSFYHDFLQSFGNEFTKLTPPVFGGKERQDSVFLAMEKNADYFLPEDNLIAIHDGARPFLTTKLLKELYQAAQKYGGAAPCLSLTDTVKEIDDTGFILSHPDRKKMKAIQTPQIFHFDLFWQAIQDCRKKAKSVTDDTEIFSCFSPCGKVKLIEGNSQLFKITYAEDIERAQKIIEMRK